MRWATHFQLIGNPNLGLFTCVALERPIYAVLAHCVSSKFLRKILEEKLDVKVPSPHLNYKSLTRVHISQQLGLNYYDGVTVTLSLAN